MGDRRDGFWDDIFEVDLEDKFEEWTGNSQRTVTFEGLKDKYPIYGHGQRIFQEYSLLSNNQVANYIVFP